MARGPLRAIFYTDEVTPGNVLAINPSRKSWCVYMSFADFPPEILSQEVAWVTICIQRTSFVNTLEGNMSQVFKKVLQEMFENPKAQPQHGLFLHDYTRLAFIPSILAQDGAAHKYIWSIKGDSGSKSLVNMMMKSPMQYAKLQIMLRLIWPQIWKFGNLWPG